MMIGILTFHRANNLGAVLQASALQNYIEDNISPCEIVDFVPNNEVKYSHLLRKLVHKAKLYLTVKKSKNIIKREKSFELYRKQYIRMSRKTYYGDKTMKSARNKYDILISGSDQILNTTLSGTSTSYYLDFSDCEKKLSYASSFGRANITKEEEGLIKSELVKYMCISVREESAKDIINSLISTEPSLVVDPVFLLDKDEWSKRCNQDLKIPNKFIFVYSMEKSALLEKIVKELSQHEALPVIVVRGGGESRCIVGVENDSCGPADFLRFIRDAEYIVTNSFHGSAFSIIFEKNFICIPHSKRNTRLENLLRLCGCLDRIASNSLDYSDSIINGKCAFVNIQPLISNSKKYLNNALEYE